MERCDVLVVGAGLAGLECAKGLSRMGLRVILADRRKRLDRGVRTTGIFVRRTLEDFVLPEECLGPPVRRIILYAPSLRELDVASERDEFRLGIMAKLYGRRLEECLRAAVEWRPGAAYLGSQARRGGTIATFEREGRREEISARFLVGADGASSPVARDLGLDANSMFLIGLEEVYGSRSYGQPAFHCFLDPERAPGYIAWIVDDGQSLHLGTGGVAGRFEPQRALQSFKVSLPAHLRPAGQPSERRGGRIPAGGILKRIACPRGLLVGDAAGAVSPLTAGGLDACFRLSAFAAARAEEFLSSGDPGALLPYSGERFRARLASRLFMRKTLEILGASWSMEFAHALLRTPPGRMLARHIFFGRGSFPLPAPAPESLTAC
jgi:flavin-dependent dehydrogenase